VTLCNREKDQLLQEYEKVTVKEFILGKLPESYKDAEHKYSLCLRNKCKDMWSRYLITGAIIAGILVQGAIISGGTAYEIIKNQELQKKIIELYQKNNPANPLSEIDKKLISEFFFTYIERRLSILEQQKNNLPFLYIIIALLQPDPIAFVQTHSLTDRRWIDELQRRYGRYNISFESQRKYKEKQD
jgi:hypothetical protein